MNIFLFTESVVIYSHVELSDIRSQFCTIRKHQGKREADSHSVTYG